MQKTIDVIYKDDDLVAFYKPKNLPTVPLKGQECETLLSLGAKAFPEILSPYGKNPWEGTILHRLDTPTSGIVIAARNKETYQYLVSLQNIDKIEKKYKAEISEGRKELPGFEAFPYSSSDWKLSIISSFRSFGPKGASVRPVLSKRKGDERLYKTEVEILSSKSVVCTITRGFRHQIRCHLSWFGHPIVGDSRYGGEENDFLLLEAVSVSFPYKNEKLEISL